MTRLGPWAAGALLLGAVTGFAFGNAGDDGDEGDAREPVAAKDASDEPTTTSGSATSAPRGELVCIGSIGDRPEFYKVAGVVEAGAHELAEHLGKLESSAEVGQLDREDAARVLRTGVLADAEHGPILLAVRLTNGDVQRTLARDLLEASPRSVVVIVQPTGTPDPDSKLGFPERSIVVGPSATDGGAAFAAPWADQVADVAEGRSRCTPPGG